MILDRETGVRWQDHLEREIFSPLDTPRTTAYVSLGKREGWPSAAPYFGLLPTGIERLTLEKSDETMQSAGGLLTTPRDVARWLEFQINDGRLDGKQIVDADVVRATHEERVEGSSPSPLFPQSGYGLGWAHGAHGEHLVLSHGGGFAGFRSVVSFLPEERIGVAVFVNESSVGGRLMGVVAQRAYDWWLGLPVDGHDEAVRELASMVEVARGKLAADLEKRAAREWQLTRPNAAYTGRFLNDLYGTIEISEVDDGLEVRMGNLHCRAEAFTKPETMRVELVPGRGEVFLFQPAEGTVEQLVYDGVAFVLVSGS